MSGKKFVLLMFAAVILIGVITYALYLATRQLDYEPPESGQPASPGATRYAAAPTYGTFAEEPATIG